MGNQSGDSTGLAISIVTWVLFGVLVILFITFIALLIVGSGATVSVSEAQFQYVNVDTPRFDETAVSSWVKVRYKGGTAETDLPTSGEIKIIVDSILLNTTGDAPAGTSWSIVAQLVGEKLARDITVISGVSVQLKTIATNPENAIYTQGGIVPLAVP